MKTLSLVTSLAALTLSVQTVGAMPVPLYATPDQSTRVIAMAELDSSSIEHSQSVTELPGWNFAAYSGPITGYVALEDIDGSGMPAQGAPLFLQPSKDAEAIASILPSDTVSLEPSTTPGFFLVTLQSSIGLYYFDAQPVEIIKVSEVIGTVETPTEAVMPAEVGEPEPVELARPPAPKQNPVLVDTSFTLRGTLQTKSSFLYFFAPRYGYLLKDDEGARLAWLELEGAVLARPLSSLIGKEVVVYGDRKQRADGKGAYIAVRSIRIAF